MMEEGNSKTQTQKVEDDLSPPSAPLSSSFFPPSSSLVLSLLCLCGKRERLREEENEEGGGDEGKQTGEKCCKMSSNVNMTLCAKKEAMGNTTIFVFQQSKDLLSPA